MSEFTCAECGGTFELGWSDEEAAAESLATWGVAEPANNPEMVLVCDDCYKLIMLGVNN